MSLLRTTIQYLAAASLILAAAQIYLTVNKLWKRKHERAVAESISIMGEFVGLIPLVLLTVNFMIDGQWAGAVDGMLWMLAAAVTITIGTGLWVEGRRQMGFFRLLRDALELERGEVGYLAKSFFRPSGAETILRILGHVALLDDELDARERAFIQEFVDSWGIDFSWEELRRSRTGGHVDYINLRRDVQEYLGTSPPPPQVSQLGDVLHALVKIDDSVSHEEALMLDELDGMLQSYLEGDEGAVPLWGVVIVPQTAEQDHAISSLLPDVQKRELHGGEAYVAGAYHSADYAEVVGEEYRALNFFTAVTRLSDGAPLEHL